MKVKEAFSKAFGEVPEGAEVFASIPGYENYEVSSNGKLIRIDGDAGVQITPYRRNSGYVYAQLHKNGKPWSTPLHRLIMLAFCGDCPDGQEVCHNNGIRDDNRLENLRYATRKQNALDRRIHGTNAPGSLNPRSKLTESQVIYAREMQRSGKRGVRILARELGVCRTTMQHAVDGVTWKHVPRSDRDAHAFRGFFGEAYDRVLDGAE